jgi:hypothetical protein
MNVNELAQALSLHFQSIDYPFLGVEWTPAADVAVQYDVHGAALVTLWDDRAEVTRVVLVVKHDAVLEQVEQAVLRICDQMERDGEADCGAVGYVISNAMIGTPAIDSEMKLLSGRMVDDSQKGGT